MDRHTRTQFVAMCLFRMNRAQLFIYLQRSEGKSLQDQLTIIRSLMDPTDMLCVGNDFDALIHCQQEETNERP